MLNTSGKTRIRQIKFLGAIAISAAMAASPASADILFKCEPSAVKAAKGEMNNLLKELHVSPRVYQINESAEQVEYSLATPKSDTSTVYLKFRTELGIEDEVVELPSGHGSMRTQRTVSRKEILLALMQHGRQLVLEGAACNVEALVDHIGVRQYTVAWAENLEWGWPEGGPAKWNTRYWNKGTLNPSATLTEAMTDVFTNRTKYEIGCYTATKFVVIQGALDYYSRVKKDAQKTALVTQRLMSDGEALVGIEPRKMWSFERDFVEAEVNIPGKLLTMQTGVAAENFVPGDWMYFLNTDAASYEKTGYEGSNAVYLGRNRFNDHYNDNDHGYRYREKLEMVYQWRNGVFSRARDYWKMQPLTQSDYERFGRTPAEGGFLLDVRLSPYLFGYEKLPVLPKSTLQKT